MSETAATPAPSGVITQSAPENRAVSSGPSLWEADGFSFGDVLDMVNPLQHLPLVSSVYRRQTGDAIGGGSRLVGDALFGSLTGGALNGVASAVTALADVAVEAVSGLDMGGLILENLNPRTEPPPPSWGVVMNPTRISPLGVVGPGSEEAGQGAGVGSGGGDVDRLNEPGGPYRIYSGGGSAPAAGVSGQHAVDRYRAAMGGGRVYPP